VYGELLRSTQGITFFATPHRGGNGATLGRVAAKALSFMSGYGRNDLVKSLKKKSKTFSVVFGGFRPPTRRFPFLEFDRVQASSESAHEPDSNYMSSSASQVIAVLPTSKVVVDHDSAILCLPGHRERVLKMDRDQRQICNFEDGRGFTMVARQLNRIAEHAIRSLESKGGRENGSPLPIITVLLPSKEAVSAPSEPSVFQYQPLTRM
jgi:hypothetical protein